MSGMASGAVPDGEGRDTGARRSDEAASSVTQLLEDEVDSMLERRALCDRVLKDLRDLKGVLVRKALQDVSIPTQK